MKPALGLLVVLTVSGLCFSQDLKVREEAVRLLEQANAVSSPATLPNLERIDTFRVFGEAGIKEGSFTRMAIQGTGRRDEYIFGDYDLINVWTRKQVAVAGTDGILPPELDNVVRITPMYLLTFDEQDVIRNISDRSMNGRPAHCIAFDTIHGEQTDNNELCVDAANGTLLFEKINGEVIENSDFFPFAGVLFPGKINYSSGGAQKIEITQTMTALSASDNVLAAPSNSRMHKVCAMFRRPFGVSMPQPKPGNGGGNSDVVIRGMAGMDGKMYNPTIQYSDRPELNAEALQLASQWTFTPAMCDGRPDAHEVDFILHFKGR